MHVTLIKLVGCGEGASSELLLVPKTGVHVEMPKGDANGEETSSGVVSSTVRRSIS